MTNERVRNVLAGFIAGSFGGALAALYLAPIPTANKDLIVFMLGQLSGFMGAVMAFNFGTSKGSVDKSDMLHKALTAAPTGRPGDPVSVTEEDK